MRSICSTSYYINLLSNFLSKQFWKFTLFSHTWKFKQNDIVCFSTIKKDLKFTTEYLPTSHLGMVLQKATVIQIHRIYVLQTCGYLLAEGGSNITVLVAGKIPKIKFQTKKFQSSNNHIFPLWFQSFKIWESCCWNTLPHKPEEG